MALPPPSQNDANSGNCFGIKTDELGRRIWDKNFFSLKAQQRQYENGADPGMDFLKPHLQETSQAKRVPPPIERTSLKQRKDPILLDRDLGKMKVITASTPKPHQGGYWCEVCECLIKDSQAYLDHLNGKKHNRLLGMSMTVERVSKEKVVERLEKARLLKQKQQEAIANGEKRDDLSTNITLRLEELEKASKKKKKKAKKDKKKDSAEELPVDPVLSQLFPGCSLTIEPSLHDPEESLPMKTSQRLSRFDIPPTTL